MQTVKIKPLSVNDCWQGKRFKTKKYHQYERILGMVLKKEEIPSGPLEIHFTFGFSNVLSDYDNPVKPLQDIICKRFGIDDRRFFHGSQTKIIVPKGEEFFSFEIKKFEK